MMMLLSRVATLINEFKWHVQGIRFEMTNASEGKGVGVCVCVILRVHCKFPRGFVL